ncbi:MAG: hypothetical protein WKF73_18940 [Nocardioidaceae bacterium]
MFSPHDHGVEQLTLAYWPVCSATTFAPGSGASRTRPRALWGSRVRVSAETT